MSTRHAYAKVSQTNFEISPVKQLPILCCPVCSSIKGSSCTNCGTFICNNIHNNAVKEIHFYFNNKKGIIVQGHDPVCTQPFVVDEQKIAHAVVDLLEKRNYEVKKEAFLNAKFQGVDFSNIVPAKMSNVPEHLKKFIGLSSSQAKYIDPNVNIIRMGDSLASTSLDQINLLCNDEESGIIIGICGEE